MSRLLPGLVLFLATAWVAYTGTGRPFAPACAPTGRTKIVQGIEFVEIGPGWFLMGSNANGELPDLLGRACGPLDLPWADPGRLSDEMPVHRVTFPRGFWIAKCEITNEQFERFDPDHPRTEYSPGDHDPVVIVSWDNATAYCSWVAEKAGLSVRLPTEAEWEAACRGGNRSEYCFGDDETVVGEYAWTRENSSNRAHEVGTKKANAWGLHDLHGNVWEWVEDTWHPTYEAAPTDGSAWIAGGVPAGSPLRVFRGGGWEEYPLNCRSSFRVGGAPTLRHVDLGFRPVMDHE
jgi:formylglycine-generating enzyme required for sulfatase activity